MFNPLFSWFDSFNIYVRKGCPLESMLNLLFSWLDIIVLFSIDVCSAPLSVRV